MASARTRSAIRSMGLENIRFAMRSILVQRLRSFLTLLGIVSGVATVIAMVSFVAGFNDAITPRARPKSSASAATLRWRTPRP